MSLLRLALSRRWRGTTLLVLLAVGVMIRLGFWQLERLEQRRAFNDHVRQMQAAAPIDLNAVADANALLTMEYRAAYARGSFDFERQIALRNQFWGDPQGFAQYGYHLLTPLRLDGGRAVLVDRGWIPPEFANPETWGTFDEPAAEVFGVLRLPLQRGELGGGVPDQKQEPGEFRRFWNNLDTEQLRSQFPYELLPIYLQQAPPPGEEIELPYKSLPKLELTEGPHLSYAVQWFVFAALVFFGYPVFLKRNS